MLETREAVVGVNVGLAFVCWVVSIVALYQLIRIHSRNVQLGWTRQKVFHVLVGTSNLGYFLYFVLTVVASCKGWVCWSFSCGFFAMEFPKILLFAAYLLLLSFWVDVCHQSNDDYDDDEYNSQEPLLEMMDLPDSCSNNCGRLCTSWPIDIGSRQKSVILVTVLVFAITFASTMLMWVWREKNTTNSRIVAQVYAAVTAVVNLLLGGALASYGLVLVLKMKKVRSVQVANEMRKVSGLAIVSIISFTSSSLISLTTNIPPFCGWKGLMDDVSGSVLLVLYYVVGSSLPSAFILFVMKDLPPPPVVKREEESRTIAFINEADSVSQHPQRWTATASIGNQFSRASPI